MEDRRRLYAFRKQMLKWQHGFPEDDPITATELYEKYMVEALETNWDRTVRQLREGYDPVRQLCAMALAPSWV